MKNKRKMITFLGLNLYTWGGIFSIFITYYLIQKGATISAQNNKKEIEEKIETASIRAITTIEETTEKTRKRIEESADEIIADLKQKTSSLSVELNELELLTRRSTERVKKEIAEKSKETQKTVIDENILTRNELQMEGDSSRKVTNLEGSKTRDYVSNKVGSSLSILKNHLLDKLKPTVFTVTKIWQDLVRNDNRMAEYKDRGGIQMMSKSIDLSNKLSDEVQKMYSEIRITETLIKDCKSNSNDRELDELSIYLAELGKPHQEVMEFMMNTSGGKFSDSYNEKFKDMYSLNEKFELIYAEILKLK